MSSNSLQVVSVDYLPNHSFVMYFSDGTFATMSAHELAECIPDRKRAWDDQIEADGALEHLLDVADLPSTRQTR
jgi:hypothetical protein